MEIHFQQIKCSHINSLSFSLLYYQNGTIVYTTDSGSLVSMLALPLQRVQRIDLVPILKSFLNTSFGSGTDERFEGDLTGFQVSNNESWRDWLIIFSNISNECFIQTSNNFYTEVTRCCYCSYECLRRSRLDKPPVYYLSTQEYGTKIGNIHTINRFHNYYEFTI